MMKTLSVSAAALAMMTGVAFAQGMSSDTTTSSQTSQTTTTVAPGVGTYSSSKSQKSIDSNGVETDKSQSYTSGAGGSKASTTTRTIEPDGSQTRVQHDERTVSPAGDTTTNRSTTTTVVH
jgi:hypothetical protein